MRAILFVILIAAFLGAGYFVYSSQGGAPVPTAGTAPPVPAQITYLVSARPLPAGTLVRDSDFGTKTVASADLPPHAVADSPEARGEFRGALVPHYIDGGAPLTYADVLRPRDRGFLATVLTAGKRAVSIAVDAVSGVAGLVWPGDRVDVLLTQEADPSVAPPSHRIMSATVLHDVRVIAVDQQIVQGAAAGEAAGHVARTVTLEVSPEQAQMVAVAERMGQLSLSIRPLTDSIDEAEKQKPVFGSDVTPDLGHTVAVPASTVQVIQGDQRSEVRFR